MKKAIPSESYHLLHPKITFLLTSITKDGKPNVMTCAWATPVSDDPPIVIVCVSKGHYTTRLIKQTKEFVINIPARKLLKALWICGRVSGRDTDKFKKAKLETVAAKYQSFVIALVILNVKYGKLLKQANVTPFLAKSSLHMQMINTFRKVYGLRKHKFRCISAEAGSSILSSIRV